MGFFGTDGVRGKSSISEEGGPIEIFEQNMIFTPELCGMIAISASNTVGPGCAIVGWDRRPHNELYAELVIEKLSHTGRDVLVIGESCTPALQYTMIANNAALGIMITASHNPVDDTGMKVILEGGRKPSELEESVIEKGVGIQNMGVKSIVIGDIKHIVPHEYLGYVRSQISENIGPALGIPRGLLIDGSSGWISSWLSELLADRGIDCVEVCDRKLELNHNCGAGNLYEGLTASWLDCKESEHALLSKISRKPRGEIIGFSFDGDGDRCLMIVSRGDGIEVIGGDGFLRLYSESLDENEDFSVAYTIQSSLDIPQCFRDLSGSKITETGVGDRLLQHALLNAADGLRIGAEPSGHVILEHKYQDVIGLWGDGVITMLQFLRIGTDPDVIASTIFSKNTCINLSRAIFPSDRRLWQCDNLLSKKIITTFSDVLGVDPNGVRINKVKDKSETLIIESSDLEFWSLTVRNSGTEQKTRITLRSTGNEEDLAKDILGQVSAILESYLKLPEQQY